MPPKAPPPAELLGKPFKWPKTLPPDNDRQERIKKIFEELNRPSKARLATALKQRGIAYSTKDIEDVVSKSTEKQQQLPVYNYKEGKIAATSKNSRWMVDTINLTSRPSTAKGQKESYKYIFCCIDVFTRKLMAKPSTSISPEAAARAFEEFTTEHGIPKQLDSDSGAEYTSKAFTDVLERMKIGHIVGSPKDKNKLAVIDRAIGTLKRAILIGKGAWADKLDAAVKGYNAAPQSHLLDVAPDNADGNAELTFHLQKQAAQDIRQNSDAIQKRKTALEKTNTFRAETDYKGFRRRAGQATHSGEVHKVASVEGSTVTDTKDKTFPTKFVAPVAAGSESVTTAASALGGSAVISAKQKRIMKPFVDELSKHIGNATLNAAGVFLRGLPNFEEKAREAGINQKSLIANILRLFPATFKVDTGASGGAASVRVLRKRRITGKS